MALSSSTSATRTSLGWAALPDCASLGRAAQVCAVFAGYDGQDHTVDLHGWRPSLELIDGPDPGGFAGVIQTEQNLLEPAVPHTDLRAHPPPAALDRDGRIRRDVGNRALGARLGSGGAVQRACAVRRGLWGGASGG
jgi:hypothetical protein